LASGCATDRQRLAAAEEAKATETMIAEAIEIGKRQTPFPPFPAECRGTIRTGVVGADRVDVALLKQDRAVSRANETMAACARLYDKLREAK
jgi:hypothetical protein